MTKKEANDLLNKVSEGYYASIKEITIALFITGDITAHEAVRSSGVDIQASTEGSRSWNERSQRLVETCDSGNREAARVDCC